MPKRFVKDEITTMSVNWNFYKVDLAERVNCWQVRMWVTECTFSVTISKQSWPSAQNDSLKADNLTHFHLATGEA